MENARIEKTYRLIIRQRHINEESLEALVSDLRVSFGIDAYSARMNLKGDGLGILAFDSDASRLELIGELLERYEYEWFVSDLNYPKTKPFIAKGFKLTRESLVFSNAAGLECELPSGSRVMVLAASFAPSLMNKIIHKAASIRGSDARISTQEKFSAVMNSGQAVLDIYVLPPVFREGIADHGNIQPIRLTPGGFDPSSLGKYATSSSIKNMETALRIVKKYAGKFSLELDFGLFSMPGVQLVTEGVSSRENNLKALINYGWLLQNLYRNNEYCSRNSRKTNAAQAIRAVAEVAGVASAAGAVVTAEAVAASGDKSGAAHEKAHMDQPIRQRFLPPPPPERNHSSTIGRWPIVSIAFVAFMLIGALLYGTAVRFSGEIITLWWTSIGRNGISFFAVGLVLFYMTFRYLKLKRWIENTPTSKARSMSMGMVEMIGTVERMYNLIAPVSQTACVYYRLRKYVKNKGRNGESGWTHVGDTDSGPVPFILRDDTGSVVVEPEGADMRSLHSESFHGGLSGMGLMNIPADVKYIEETIPELASVYVLGFASPRRADIPSVEELKTEKLRQLKQDKQALMQYDENDDGRIDEKEWEKARRDAEYSALKDALSEKEEAEKLEEKAVIHKPLHRGLPFIIAEESEGRLTFWFNVGGVLYFAGAIASSVAGVVLLLRFLALG